MNILDIPIALDVRQEEKYHSDRDILVVQNQRKLLMIIGLSLTVIALAWALAVVSARKKDVYAFAISADGQEYVLGTPRHAISLQEDFVRKQAKQNITAWAEAYYRRSKEDGAHDWKRAQTFMTSALNARIEGDVEGPNGDSGWLKLVSTGRQPENEVHVSQVVMREGELTQQPFGATVYFSKIYAGRREQWRSDIAFYISPETAASMGAPLRNAMGLYVERVQENKIY